VHIITYCPSCQSRYQLEPDLVGKQIRCPNPVCRQIFEVQVDGKNGEPENDDSPDSIRWQDEPPPVRRAEPTKADPPSPRSKAPGFGPSTVPTGAVPPVSDRSAPSDDPPPAWPAPPVGVPDESAADSPAAAFESTPPPVFPPTARARRRRSLWLTVGISLSVALLSTLVTVFVWSALHETEENLFQAAKDLYAEGKFAQAADKFDRLIRDYPDSPQFDQYDLLAALNRARDDAEGNPNVSPEKALVGLEYFVETYGKRPTFEAYRADLVRSLNVVAERLATSASEAISAVEGIETLKERLVAIVDLRDKAQRALELAKRISPKANDPDGRIGDRIASLEAQITQAKEKLEAFLEARRLAPTGINIPRARKILKGKKLLNDSAGQEVLARLRQQFLEQITYTRARVAAGTARKLGGAPRLMIVPTISGAGQAPATGLEVVFALARGMLYALSGKDGCLLWAVHVGVDASSLPVRVPLQEGSQEIVLILSAERNELTARRTDTGMELWHQRFDSPCLARPLSVGHLVYVPTYEGDLHEINAVSGELVGTFHLGMHLTAEGIYQESTGLIYLPADSLYVFVLNAAAHKCVGILESDHPSGSMRNEPLIVNPGSGSLGADVSPAAGYLVLSQTAGLGSMTLRAFQLPVVSWVESPTVERQIRMPGWPGWSWFPPIYDGERICQVTDRGSIRVFGVNQMNNQDPPVFALASEDLKSSDAGAIGRAEVVHAEEHSLWVLMGGELQRLMITIEDQKGLHLAKRWRQPLPLGAPLHTAQRSKTGDTLYVVTQSSARKDCLTTAVASSTGEVRWQTTLGMVCRGDPIVVQKKMLALDQGGGFYLFDATAKAPRPGGTECLTGGEVKAPPLPQIAAGPYLVPGADGKSALEILCVRRDKPAADGSPYDLILRQFTGKQLKTLSFPLPYRLAGTPGVSADHLVLPLADDRFYRLSFTGQVQAGLAWRKRETDPNSHGYVVALGPDEFLTTDGFRGLSRWKWPAADLSPSEEKTVDLGGGAIVGPPTVLRLPRQPAEALLCIAESDGNVILLRAADLSTVRRWQLSGTIDSSPFLRGGHIGCIVEGDRLVWLDPDKDSPLWHYETAGARIVGQPNLAKGRLIVADLSGRLVGLDPQTGATGWEYRTPKGAIPAAAPVLFGQTQLFVPLADGSVLLPRLDPAGPQAAALPLF
jgi:outer membrane protein assembly factor BamB